MVGLVPVHSEVADYGAFFISSYVYLDMCGRGTIGFAKTLAFTGQISPTTGDSFTLETPAGVVTVGLVWGADGSLDAVRIRNVPSYVGLEGLEVDVEGVEPMTSVTPMEMKKRADIVDDGNIADDVVANAPATEDHFFLVPKVVE